MRRAPKIKLSEAERNELAAWSRSQILPVRQVSRARILLLAADGWTAKAADILAKVTRAKGALVKSQD